MGLRSDLITGLAARFVYFYLHHQLVNALHLQSLRKVYSVGLKHGDYQMAPTKEMLFSSPDPLGMSNSNISIHSPTKQDRQPLITSRKALGDASGNSQVQEFYIQTSPHPTRNASPRKSPRKSPSQSTQSTSPWRIRLTVQAEPVDEIQRAEKSPVKCMKELTTTTTVPLKGGDDTPPAARKKGRGRPRNSLNSPVKRSGTPKPKTGGRRKIMPESPKKQEVDEHGEMATPLIKPRGRPKKKMEPKDREPSSGLSQKNDVDVWLGSVLAGAEETADMKSKTTQRRSRGRRQEITPIKIAIDSDIESRSGSNRTMEDTPKELASSIGNRHDGKDITDQTLCDSNEAPKAQTERSLVSRLSHVQSSFGKGNENGLGPVIQCAARSLSPCSDQVQDQTEYDPNAQHQEYDSILESEGFSMVSVSSLPSVGSNSASSPQQYGSLHKCTPIVTSSPSVAPAPDFAVIQSSPRQLEVPSDGTPKLAKIVRAGIALQGALSPKDRSQKLGSPFQESQKPSPFLTTQPPLHRGLLRHAAKVKSPEAPSKDLFRGFSAGTRRELKAGLRLGEELAKRQQPTSQRPIIGPKGEDDVFRQTDSPNYPELPASDSKEGYNIKPLGSQAPVRYPLLTNNQLPSPERSLVDEEDNYMSWKADTPIKQEAPAFESAQILVSDESMGPNASTIDYTMMAREEEWQREREAVSKQIEMANKSQVIMIDSDDEEERKQEPEEDLADNDIWQSEAQSAEQSRDTTPEASSISLQPEIIKPRRSKLPSSWRRNSQVVYSDEVEPTESDLFWQPNQSQARASNTRNARKVQNQDRSDISAVSVVDTSLENTRKAEAQIQLEAFEAWPIQIPHLGNDEASKIATSAQRILHDGSIQHTDPTIKPAVVVISGQNHTVPERPPTPKDASLRDVVDVAEKIAALEVTAGVSVDPISGTSKDSKAVIDPCLIKKKTPLSSASNKPIRPIRPIEPLQSAQSSTSWLSHLTTPIWSVFAPAASVLPAATKEDILCSSPHEPLCQLTPWEECHFRALGPLYYGSLLYGAHLFPFNSRSPSARYCGTHITTKLGWSRKITPEDCGITDAFMVLLDERGYALGEPGAQWIDEGMVIAKCVALWVGMIKRGEIEADRSKGEKIGLRDQGDRKWTKDDIDWASNQSEYFERKRREFDGLPSWKKKA